MRRYRPKHAQLAAKHNMGNNNKQQQIWKRSVKSPSVVDMAYLASAALPGGPRNPGGTADSLAGDKITLFGICS